MASAIRMYHPKSGYHVVHAESDRKTLEAVGWKVISDKEFQAHIVAKNAKSEPEQKDALSE